MHRRKTVERPVKNVEKTTIKKQDSCQMQEDDNMNHRAAETYQNARAHAQTYSQILLT